MSGWFAVYMYVVLRHWHKVPSHWHKHSVISDLQVTLRNFCFESLGGAVMHIRVFHFCLATNRQQVAQLLSLGGGCQSTDKKFRLGRHSDSFPSLSLPLGVLEVPWEIENGAIRSYFDILTITIQRKATRWETWEIKQCPFSQFLQQQSTLSSFSIPEQGINHP